MPHSRPNPRFVISALLLVAIFYVGLSVVLAKIACWAESRFESYPYLAGEDPIRLLLPTVHAANDGGTLLLGPSAIGEDLLYEELERRWGSRVRSGGLSLGTLDSCYLFLAYLEQAYGAQALPERVVLGMKPRVLANLPRLFGPHRQPDAYPHVILDINRYSTRFRVVAGELGTTLEPKNRLPAVIAWLRFHLTKQQPRYRTGLLAAIEHLLDPDPLKVGFQHALPFFTDNLRDPFTPANLRTSISFVRRVGWFNAIRNWLRAYRSAYTNQFMPPLSETRIAELIAQSELGFHWDARKEDAMVTMQLGRLAAFVERHKIELVIVYLPVHPLVQAGYDPENLIAYREALERHLPMATFVDLWDKLPRELFFDKVHLTFEGAQRATALLCQSIPDGPRPSRRNK